MLKQRILTASVLALLALGAVLTLSVVGFGMLLLFIALLCAWEWAALAGLAAGRRWGYCGLLLLLILALWPVSAHPALAVAGLVPVLVAWCIFAVRLLQPHGSVPALNPISTAVVGLIALSAAWLALTSLRQAAGPGPVLFLLLLIWAADTGAYFAGRRWGQRKLAPKISPGKTWEGVWGAAAAVLGLALMGAVLLDVGTRWPLLLLISLVTAGFSILGDLLESLLKRQCGLKDSSTLLPGHGCVLDRLDSLIAAAPVFFLGWHGLLP